MFFSPEKGLADIKDFCQVQMIVYPSFNFNSCSKRLCEEIHRSNSKKENSCESTLVIYMNYLSMLLTDLS